MKKATIARLIFAFILATQVSGCIIWPWWDDDGRGHHRDEYRGDRYEGHREGHGERGEYR